MLITDLEPILTTLVEDGVFGNVTYLSIESDDTKKGFQFASDLNFVNLTVDGPSGKEVLPLVFKFPKNDQEEKNSSRLNIMFHNEVTMYKEILPNLGMGTNLYPQLFYGLATNGADPAKDIVVLENLKYKHFFPSKKKLFLDIDHISAVIKKIAEFHSFSFILKHEDKERFLEMTSKLKSTDPPPEARQDIEKMSFACMERGIKPILKDNINVGLLNEFLHWLKHPYKTKYLILSSDEPFDVICHGDFYNNNILYKFDENGEAIDCVFLDFQYPVYGSPVIDLSFYLYLHTTPELREKYWDMLLKLYWDTMRKCVPNHIIIPSFEEFSKHFAARVIFGYMIAGFFLPIMMKEDPMKENEEKTKTVPEEITRLTSNGGEEAEQKLSEIVLHLLNKGYIQAYIDLCKNKMHNF